MRKLLLSLLGLLTSLTGLLILLPIIESLSTPQIILNEAPWIPAAAGTAAAGLSLRRRAPLGWAFGLFGAALSLVPLMQVRRAIANMDQTMREGFGADYESCIPPIMQQRVAPVRLSLTNCFGAAIRATRDTIHVKYDVPYLERPTRTLKLDVYYPPVAPAVGDRYPAVLVLHAGGWRNGDKGEYFAANHRYLAAQGYVVFDAQYRFTQEIRWSGQLDDVREALRWIKSHAAEYQVDPTKIVLMGRSAGGHLALSAAYRALGNDEDTAVCGVVGIYAPINLRITGEDHDIRVTSLLGGTSYEIPEVYADASPLDFAQGDHIPPTLLLHGYMDDVVSPVHSELLLNKLKINRTPAAVLRVPWARHGFDAVMVGTGAQITQYYLDRFLAWCIYR
ncbi:MAG TPA: alpha/beta hydrolase [Phototrophicaceae bacterium]|jgi:acetyl esterase/lipase|nr:alpha/beta hydrolase [Phototrophicaceae bacterium]